MEGQAHCQGEARTFISVAFKFITAANRGGGQKGASLISGEQGPPGPLGYATGSKWVKNGLPLTYAAIGALTLVSALLLWRNLARIAGLAA